MTSLLRPENRSFSVLSRENIVSFIVFLTVTYLVRFCLTRRSLGNIPPGPRPWPVVGNFGAFFVPSVLRRKFGLGAENEMQFLAKLARLYGDVFSLFVGTQLVVVLNSYDAVRDALSNHPEVFSDRPDIPAISIMTQRKGNPPFFLYLIRRWSELLLYLSEKSLWELWFKRLESDKIALS